MNPATAAQILQAWRNEHRPPQTIGVRIKAALEHARNSKKETRERHANIR